MTAALQRGLITTEVMMNWAEGSQFYSLKTMLGKLTNKDLWPGEQHKHTHVYIPVPCIKQQQSNIRLLRHLHIYLCIFIICGIQYRYIETREKFL